jgi:hypothetical protein
MKYLLTTIAIAFLLFSSLSWAHEGITTSHRDAMQIAMTEYIQDITNKNGNGMFPIYDPDEKTVVQLKFKDLHDSVEIHGRTNPYFISCANFTNKKGVVYDLDFLVSKNHEVVAVLIHAKKGRKTLYDIH